MSKPKSRGIPASAFMAQSFHGHHADLLEKWLEEDAKRAATDTHATCACGNGWTFDFQAKRVYCASCEGK
jgi:hypothetical protein